MIMQHSFDVDIACKYGIQSAILFNHLAFWIAKNEANGVNHYDGNTWTYNSREAFSKLFPYMTPRQISYALEKLIEAGLIVTGNYNNSAYDRTLWYAITEKGKSILQNCQMEETKKENGKPENVKPIPYINTDKNTNEKPNINNLFSFSSSNIETFMETLKAFEEMRKKIKKPLTDKAKELIVKKLSKLSNGNGDIAIKIMENSIENSWQGVFPLKNDNGMVTNQKADKAKEETEYPF